MKYENLKSENYKILEDLKMDKDFCFSDELNENGLDFIESNEKIYWLDKYDSGLNEILLKEEQLDISEVECGYKNDVKLIVENILLKL